MRKMSMRPFMFLFWLLWSAVPVPVQGVVPPSSLSTSSTKPTTPLANIFDLRGGAVGEPFVRTRRPPPPPKQSTWAWKNKSSSITKDNKDGAALASHVFNLIKSIVGAGVLGLPAGVAAFGNAPSAIVPALVLLVVIGSMSAYGFSLIGRLCSYTHTTSYRQVWEETVGPKSGWIPALFCLLVTGCSVLAYSMILSNTIPALAAFLNDTWKITAQQGLLGITLAVLLPLCLLKDLKSLAPFSLVGIIGMIYTATAMVVRFVQGTYRLPDIAPLGQHLESGMDDVYYDMQRCLEEFGKSKCKPYMYSNYGSKGMSAVFSSNAFVLISMLSTAYMAHYNAPKFYESLRDAPKFRTLVQWGFGGSILLMALVTAAGYLTFGAASQGLILNNYNTHDKLMTASRFAVTLSLIFSYPLAFVGVRDGVLEFAKVPPEKRTDTLLNTLTVILLALVTALALLVSDLRLVMAFGGATWGNALTYVLPSYMMHKYCQKLRAKSSSKKSAVDELVLKEWPWAMVNGLLGLAMGCIGTVSAIQSM